MREGPARYDARMMTAPANVWSRTIPCAAALAAGLLAACGDKPQTSDSGFDSATISGGAPTTGEVPGTSTGASTGAGTGSGTDSGVVTTSGVSGGSSGTTGGGVETSSGGTTEALTSTGGGPKLDVGAQPDIEPVQCIECSLTIDSKQSGTLAVNGNNVFGTALLSGQIVYALGTQGAGRFIATADTSLPFNEQSDCPIIEWLAGVPPPDAKLFWFGWGPQDGPKQWNYPGMSSGIHLPAEYVGNPAKLAADFDIVLYLEGSGQFDGGDQPTDEEMKTLVDYVTIHGGGLYASSEFAGYLKPADYASINRVLLPLGVEALEVNLDWGNVNGQIEFDCFPEPQ